MFDSSAAGKQVMQTIFLLALAAWTIALFPVPARSTDEIKLATVVIDSSPAARRRGAKVVTSVCTMCHNLKYLRYRDLTQLGLSSEEVAAMGNGADLDAPITSMLDDDTKMASFAMIPPDLSLMAKAREGKGRYIYSFVTGFEQDAQGHVTNRLLPGVHMPDVLNIATAGPKERKEIEAQALDAASFLEWAADPRADERRHLGFYVLAYLGVLTALAYFLKRKIWSRIGKPD